MGYYADGHVEITATEEQMAHAALEVENIINSIGHVGARGVVRAAYQEAKGNVIERALEASGFEHVDVFPNDQGGVLYYGTYQGKWREDLSDFVARVAAAAHMNLTARFQGEDGERWAWEQDNGAFREVNLVDLPYYQVDSLQAADATLTAIRGLLSEDDATLAAAVRALLAAQE